MIVIDRLRREDFFQFYELICALARYEHLTPPDNQAQQRLYHDAFERTPPRYEALVARDSQDKILYGYSIYFEVYSSFSALPTLFIEDIFVVPEYRRHGIGRAFMHRLARIASERGCGRMEWMVLDWNEPAQNFYFAINARQLKHWHLYRLEEQQIHSLAHWVNKQ